MITNHTSNAFSTEKFEEILVYFSNSIHTKSDEDEILWDLAKNCIAKLGFVDCVIYLVDYDKKVLVQKAAYGPKNPKDKEIYQPTKIALGEGISGSVALSGKAEIISDTSKDPRYVVDDQNRLSEITVPMTADGVILGVIDCEHPEKNFFTQQHARMLSAVAAICSIKIHSIRTNDKIHEEREKLLAIREEMLQLKLQAIRSQMNPHFIFNALSAIQHFITSERKKEALTYLSVFSKLIRFYLKHIDSETVALTAEIEMLENYFKLQKLRYAEKFNYEINTSDVDVITPAFIPSYILQILFENIIEHAIYNNYENYGIVVNFSTTPKNVEVSVVFDYLATKQSEFRYAPDYRQQLLNWQNQIRLLNTLKGYKIKKNIIFTRAPENNGGQISIQLPNLI